MRSSDSMLWLDKDATPPEVAVGRDGCNRRDGPQAAVSTASRSWPGISGTGRVWTALRWHLECPASEVLSDLPTS